MKLNLVDDYGYHVFGNQDYHIIRTCITVVSADRTIVSIILTMSVICIPSAIQWSQQVSTGGMLLLRAESQNQDAAKQIQRETSASLRTNDKDQ